ncbi:MAG: 4Fe-4S binding protein [Deltaproteobacteria bacterium]|nr:4Fe-4S binding protein [Deltaproteobacteria bacterium]
MEGFRYMDGVVTLQLEEAACVGCGMCRTVCPHGIFTLERGKAMILDRDACMECGACARNCPSEALSVTPGVGCASYVIQSWFGGSKSLCAC